MIIIGITGTLGAGKGTIVDYLVKEEGFVHYSVRGFLLKEMKRLGMPENRNSMTTLANRLRTAYGPSYITDQLYEEAMANMYNCVIESIRAPGEIMSLRRKQHFYLFAVDADPSKRYERIKNRASETDQVSYKEFLANEKREMESNDPNKQNISKCIDMADYTFRNNGSIARLINKVKRVMHEIKSNIADGKRKD
ncbi:MAG: AAA family ATPase [Bacteroidales bacterium]|nr:AAA family ATPase [Bacteroidales bacterium]